MASTSLKNKVALVTGASSGMGVATAKALSAAGARVIIAARRADRLQALVKELGGSKHAFAIQADVATVAGAQRLVADALAWSDGRLDILINNAGLSPLAMIAESDMADLTQMIDVNLTGLIAITREALPALTKQGGDIVNIGSVAVRVQNPGSATYAATKAGVAAFTESLRKEVLPHKVRVTLINPGIVKTEIAEAVRNPVIRERITKRSNTEAEHLLPEDIADLIMYCLTRPSHVVLNDILIRPSQQE